MQRRTLPALAFTIALLAAACGGKDAHGPEIAPAAPAAASPAAVEAPSSFVAWRQDADGKLESAFFEPSGDGTLAITALRPDAALVVHEGAVWELSEVVGTRPLRPCDEDGEARFVDLTVQALAPIRPSALVVLDEQIAKNRPPANESAIHHETLTLVAQAGPYVHVLHSANSDTCPVPATGAVIVGRRIVDLRDGSSVELRDLYDDAALKAAADEALPAARAGAAEQFPDAPKATIDEKMALFGVRYAWDDTGALRATLEFLGTSEAFSDMVGEEGWAFVTVPTDALPKKLAAVAAEHVPSAIVAWWKGAGVEGRGYSRVDRAVGTVGTWFMDHATKP